MARPASPILAIDAATALCSVAVWDAAADDARGRLCGSLERQGPTGEAALLPRMVADLLAGHGLAPAGLTAIAVNIGPGSFTGLRASIALAQGLALGRGLPVIAVTIAEALHAALAADDAAGLVWCALDARQGRLFLHAGGAPEEWSVAQIAAPPRPDRPVTLTGDAAAALGVALGEVGATVTVSEARQSHATFVAQAAALRLAGHLPPLPAAPLYIDPPRALLPRGGLRPPPQGWSPQTWSPQT